MNINLTQKEMYLLQDEKSHEEMCIQKYSKYSEETTDPQLKQLFKTYLGQEQKHLNTITQIMNGQTPTINQQQGQSTQQQGASTPSQNQPTQGQQSYNQQDYSMCSDVLMAEKYISGLYNTSIFEFQDANIRQVLNHIQKEEQQHGEGIYNYMKSKGMYNQQ